MKTAVEYLDVSLDAGATWHKTITAGFRGFVYGVTGSMSVNGKILDAGSAYFVEDESKITLTCEGAARVMFCFGKLHGEPIYQYGPYVD
ncbi:MAG: pirin-like C-terminal cupin domain-containing protein [Mariprofundaceae bacterium]|nr:pirin-like C-terminal cupin domain-containing protein [Mariprofundaceae bacterium]